MRLEELQYELPAERIAQRPAEPRDAARLLVLHRDRQAEDGSGTSTKAASGSAPSWSRLEHRIFRELGDYLRAGDCLVLNDTRVLPARFFCRRATGGRIEALFLRREAESPHPGAAGAAESWRVLLKPSARLRVAEQLHCEGTDTALVLLQRHERGEWSVTPEPDVPPHALLARIGQVPLPPYIRTDAAGRQGVPDERDRERYQTVYAARPGAVAAPTAGLHFTISLLEQLARAGIRRTHVTLHVGLGTFAPIEVDDLAQHRMHAEWYEAGPAALDALRATRAAGGRIVAVGTTSVRVLESLPGLDVREAAGWTDIFIYPPYRFRHVDALVTNFHLPGSTLLALVMALAGPERVRAAYGEAIARGYRFYSYGDAMLVV